MTILPSLNGDSSSLSPNPPTRAQAFSTVILYLYLTSQTNRNPGLTIMALLSILLTALIGLPLAYLIWTAHLGPLASIPGPLLGKYTDLWRLLSVLRRTPQVDERALHDKLGPVVRTGPNCVTLSDPRMISEVFSRQNILIKVR